MLGVWGARAVSTVECRMRSRDILDIWCSLGKVRGGSALRVVSPVGNEFYVVNEESAVNVVNAESESM